MRVHQTANKYAKNVQRIYKEYTNTVTATMKKAKPRSLPRALKRPLTISLAPGAPPPTTKAPKRAKIIKPTATESTAPVTAALSSSSSAAAAAKSDPSHAALSSGKISGTMASSTAPAATKTPHAAVATAAASAVVASAPHAPQPNIYDAMLGEIEDLICAAQEAQACGRLKMASTYQLLVHARLVGLGKRFDRFISTNQIIRKPKVNANAEHAKESSSSNTGDGDNAHAASAKSTKSSPGDSIRTAQAALAKILPSEVDLDYTMMEHLARAAMELHNRRTGRGLLHEREMERKHAIHEQNRKSNGEVTKHNDARKKRECSNKEDPLSKGVAWSSVEKQKFTKAAEAHGKDNVGKIAKAIGTRTEAEVKAHMKNIDGMKRIEQTQTEDLKQSIASPSKKGRGKKPPPRAMLTVPNTTFDAKRMLFEPI